MVSRIFCNLPYVSTNCSRNWVCLCVATFVFVDNTCRFLVREFVKLSDEFNITIVRFLGRFLLVPWTPKFSIIQLWDWNTFESCFSNWIFYTSYSLLEIFGEFLEINRQFLEINGEFWLETVKLQFTILDKNQVTEFLTCGYKVTS